MSEALYEALRWLEATSLAEALRSGTWSYAAVESLHLVGLASLFGAIVALDLRLLGVSRALPAAAAVRHMVPIAGIGFVLAAVSGSLMFAADASELAGNPAFRFKLVLLILAGVNAAAFHLGPVRALGSSSPPDRRPPMGSIVAGLCSLLLWTGVVVCGRLIAYV